VAGCYGTTLTSVSTATGPLTEQTSQLRSALFRVVTQRVVVTPYRGFGKPIGPILKDFDPWIWDR